MSARDSILKAIKANKPALRSLPETLSLGHSKTKEAIISGFCTVLETVLHGKVYRVGDYDSIAAHIGTWSNLHPGRIINAVAGLDYVFTLPVVTDVHSLEDVELSIIPGEIGVAENAAVWIEEGKVPYRIMPFICQHLVIVLNTENIVSNMHEAYRIITNQGIGYGVFISGPSKTADIEQSLVIGAHGPRSLTVYLMEETKSDNN